MPYFRLLLGAHHGLMNPKKTMGGENEQEFINRDQTVTGSKWSGALDDQCCWNRGVHGGHKTEIPMLNHKPNNDGYDTINVDNNNGRQADMDASLLFR